MSLPLAEVRAHALAEHAQLRARIESLVRESLPTGRRIGHAALHALLGGTKPSCATWLKRKAARPSAIKRPHEVISLCLGRGRWHRTCVARVHERERLDRDDYLLGVRSAGIARRRSHIRLLARYLPLLRVRRSTRRRLRCRRRQMGRRTRYLGARGRASTAPVMPATRGQVAIAVRARRTGTRGDGAGFVHDDAARSSSEKRVGTPLSGAGGIAPESSAAASRIRHPSRVSSSTSCARRPSFAPHRPRHST